MCSPGAGFNPPEFLSPCGLLIQIAFITGNSSLEPLLEGPFAQIHVNLS